MVTAQRLEPHVSVVLYALKDDGVIWDLSVLNFTVPSNREGLIIATFLTLVAILGKVITGFIVFGNTELNKLALGVGMISRGEVGLVFKVKGSIAESVDKVQE
jgi:Kef-type K+ transport system membrane component KefB